MDSAEKSDKPLTDVEAANILLSIKYSGGTLPKSEQPMPTQPTATPPKTLAKREAATKTPKAPQNPKRMETGKLLHAPEAQTANACPFLCLAHNLTCAIVKYLFDAEYTFD